MFIRPADLQPPGQRAGRLADFVDHRPRQTVRRNRAGRIARVDARLLDVLHDAGHDHLLAVGNGVDVDLGGVFQEAVDQHRLPLRDDERRGHESLELARRRSRFPSPGRRARNSAAPARESRPWPLRPRACAMVRAMPLAGCFSPSRCSTFANFSRSSASSIVSTLVPMIGTPALLSARARFSGVCPPNCTITPSGSIAVADVQHVLGRQRLEEQQVATCRSRSRRSRDSS